MKRFVVIGLGNFGSSIARSLYEQGFEVIALDQREEMVELIAPHVTRAAVADGRRLDSLRRVGVEGADSGVVGTGDDITASILATVALHDLGVKDVYVKVISRDHARVMERIGVSETVFPERDSALALANRLASPSLLNYVRLGGGFSIQEMAVRDEWAGKTLRDLELRDHYGLLVVATHDVLKDEIIAPPDPDRPLMESDTLLVAGTEKALAAAARRS